MYSKSAWKKSILPLRVTVPNLSNSSTQATGGSFSTAGCALAPSGPEPTESSNSTVRFRARQSSRLYDSSFCLHSSAWVASHVARQTKLWSPEAAGSLHEQPRQLATSLSPLEWQGK